MYDQEYDQDFDQELEATRYYRPGRGRRPYGRRGYYPRYSYYPRYYSYPYYSYPYYGYPMTYYYGAYPYYGRPYRRRRRRPRRLYGLETGVWNQDTAYQGGDVVSYNGRDYQAKWWTQGEEPDMYVTSQWDTPWQEV